MMKADEITKFIFGTTNIVKVQEYLQENPQIDPRGYKDGKGNSILHHLSYSDEKDLLKLYVNHTIRLIDQELAKSRQLYKKDIKQQISCWVNQKNVQGFTPILYASFNGHVQLLKYLQGLGANIHAKNDTKLNVLMMAAQNNKISSFIYFKDRINVNEVDERGSTALHWAAYRGNEETVTYLLTLNELDVDLRDSDGQTSLLVATIYGQTKIVRRLLMRGAKRYLKNKEGQKPIDIAKQSEYKNITKMLDDRYSLCDFLKFYYNVKLEYRPKKRNLQIPLVFIISTLCSILILNGVLMPKQNQEWMYLIQGLIFGIMFIFYFSLLRRTKQQPKGDLSKYINDTRKICLECVKRKPKRSYHCDICKICIQQYDHHCTWINNCVGKHNIARFIMFIFLLAIAMALTGLISGWAFWSQVTNNYSLLEKWISFRNQQSDALFHWGKLILLGLNIVLSLFFFPVFMLLLVQIKNLFINRTTYERIRGSGMVKEQLKNKNKSISLQNCQTMCGKNRQSFSSTNSQIQQQLLSN